MKLSGIELRYFRSIGADPVRLSPLKKCNVIVGQNNSGKSNVIRAMKKLSDWVQGNPWKFEELDLYRRSRENLSIIKLLFEAENNQPDQELVNFCETTTFYFELTWNVGSDPIFSDDIFRNITDFRKANMLLDKLFNRHWSTTVGPDAIRKEFTQNSPKLFEHFKSAIPSVFTIPEFRQIRPGDTYSHDGASLVELLGSYQTPVIGKDEDQKKFLQIQEFLRELLNLPKAILEVSRPALEIIINNDGLRLPLKSFGTGVHELIILVTAVLSIENSICCIEEPEIHLHPRLQREFIKFLIRETTNQYLISSHSPVFINYSEYDESFQVFHLLSSNGATYGGPILNDDSAIKALQDLGVSASDILQSNCIIWVEGTSDRILVKRWLEIMAPDLREGQDYLFLFYRQLPKISLNRDGAKGDLVNVMRINQHAILIMDSDKKSKNAHLSAEKQEIIQDCEKSGVISWVTDGHEIENYVPNEVIKRFTSSVRGFETEVELEQFEKFGNFLDRLAKKENVKTFGYDKEKVNYSRKIAELFKQDDIQGDLKEWMERIIEQIRLWHM